MPDDLCWLVDEFKHELHKQNGTPCDCSPCNPPPSPLPKARIYTRPLSLEAVIVRLVIGFIAGFIVVSLLSGCAVEGDPGLPEYQIYECRHILICLSDSRTSETLIDYKDQTCLADKAEDYEPWRDSCLAIADLIYEADEHRCVVTECHWGCTPIKTKC